MAKKKDLEEISLSKVIRETAKVVEKKSFF